MSNFYDFAKEKKFTEVYKQYKDAHPAIREIKCLEQMFPATFTDILPGDRLAGRIKYGWIGFSPEPVGLGYHIDSNRIISIINEEGYPADLKAEMEELLEYWATERTNAKVRAAYTPKVLEALPSDNWNQIPMAAAPLYRMAGSYLDYDKLLQNGIPGMKELILARKEKAVANNEDVDTVVFDCMIMALDLLAKCCLDYSERAKKLAAVTPEQKDDLLDLAKALENIAAKKPETLREAMQLSWLYMLISGTFNYGRMDVFYGDFLASDIEKGILTMDQAQELFNSLWQLIVDRKTTWNGRVILGGKGRRNEKAADDVAMLAMEASRVVLDVEPQLTLRIYDGIDQRLVEKALQVIGAGRTYPMLYNDEVNIPSVANAFNIDLKEAEEYVPFGCGEYVINHKSYGSPNGIINLLKVLELTLRNGKDALTGEVTGIKTGEFEDFETFDQLLEAYKKQTEFFVEACAEQELIEYQVAGETAPFLFLSMLYDDCIERGKPIFKGGIKYLGGTIETYGNINTADSLTAIKEVIYDKKLLTKQQLLDMMDADFEGYEQERKLLLDAPKYGNDDAAADEMAKVVHEHICNIVRDQSKRVDLHSYLVVIINNSANTQLGELTGASADGRKARVYMANANNPWGGNDKKGLTSMLNSLVKLRTDIHAGSVQNMKFSPELFKENGAVVKGVLKSYFENGGSQAMISVVNKNDLEQALVHPENYKNLFVRVGGFSARYVELDKHVQLEILSRTLY